MTVSFRAMTEVIRQLQAGEDLAEEQIRSAAAFLTHADSDTDERVDFLEALAKKGETPDEIALFVQEFLKMAVDPELDDLKRQGPTIDVCGTGGDKLDLFNVSTTSMFVIAAGGATVLKHGNRGITSKSGGADVLEALGVRLDLPREQLRECVETAGVGFIFAPAYHPAFKSVVPVRKILAERGQRTIFNIMGPLLNPARPECQLVGVADEGWASVFSQILQKLGRQSSLVVHGKTEDGRGVDEMSLMGETLTISTQGENTVTPTDLGLSQCKPEDLRGGDAEENATLLRGVLSGQVRGPKREMVALNAGAGLLCAGLVDDLKQGVERAMELIDNGAALERLELMVRSAR